MAEVVVVPRSFKLLDELEDADKDRNVPPPHAGLISLGLKDPTDMSLTGWNATIFGPQGTNLGEIFVFSTTSPPNSRHVADIADRIYTLYVEAPENYPNSPPRIRFVTKINMADVDQKTGEVNPKLIAPIWKRDSTIVLMLCHIRSQMKTATRLTQPPDGAVF